MEYYISGVLCLLCLVPLSAIAQQDTTVSVRASLTAGGEASFWLSPSGDFAFGFRQIDGTHLFLLSIWYDKVPDKTIVWYPTATEPLEPVPRGSMVELTTENGLVLADPRGNKIWRSSIDAGVVAYASMNDTGNFVLTGRNSDRLWQSFDHPTDTLLPGQVLEINEQLISRRKENNFSRGRFELWFQDDGNLVLYTINLPTKFRYDSYYSTATFDSANISNAGHRLVFNESGYLYILRRNGQRFDLTRQGAVPTTDGYHRATLNFDGVFSQYFYQKATNLSGWSSVWYQPGNICVSIGGQKDSGACGFNNICSLEENGRPSCKCPRGFSLLDPDDEYGSCKAATEVGCLVNGEDYREDQYDFELVPNIDWPTGDYEGLSPYNELDCRAACLRDCLCDVAIFLEDSCWKKKFPLSNGRFDRTLKTKVFIKIRKNGLATSKPDSKGPDSSKNQDDLIIAGSVFLGGSVFLNFVLIATICIGFSFTYKKMLLKFHAGDETSVRIFTYKELAEATSNFKEELGRGSFGIVYKGMLKTGSAINFVAVKKLDRMVQDGHKEFEAEVKAIGQTHHKNLVRLLGLCHERDNRLLVYEFLSNGALADFLFGDIKPSWSQRAQIALGAARGLLYLHEECAAQIIHCDIKPQNILLDNYYNARISDFGLAKLLVNQTHTETGIRGTKGYVAPEWFRNSPITSKVDVYSFGIVLLEILFCRRNVDLEVGDGDYTILADLAYYYFHAGAINELIKDDVEALSDVNKFERFLTVAMCCIQEDPLLRPTMRRVNQMLEGVVQVNFPPNPSLVNSVSYSLPLVNTGHIPLRSLMRIENLDLVIQFSPFCTSNKEQGLSSYG